MRAARSSILRKTAAEIEAIREAGRVVRRALNAMRDAIEPDRSTTADLEHAAVEVIAGAGATSAFLGYAPHAMPPFPAWTCISVNEEVVHGIPGRRVLKSGDVVSCDVGVLLNGYYADAASTFPVGDVSPEVERLLTVTRGALDRAVAQAKVGARVGDISHAIERHARRHGYCVVHDLVGHGVGRMLHEAPQIPNYGAAGSGPILPEGATLAIEPMVNMGRKDVEALEDQWTIVTRDRMVSAHFEHTVAVTANGALVLTQGD